MHILADFFCLFYISNRENVTHMETNREVATQKFPLAIIEQMYYNIHRKGRERIEARKYTGGCHIYVQRRRGDPSAAP